MRRFRENYHNTDTRKAGADKCEDFGTLRLIRSSKVLCIIIKNRIEELSEKVLGEDQFGFQKDKGTREPILTLRMIIGKRLQKDKSTYIYVIESRKLFSILKKKGISFQERRIIHCLYKNHSVVIKSGETEKEARLDKGLDKVVPYHQYHLTYMWRKYYAKLEF